MSTECNQFIFGFHTLNHREIRAQFDGGAITTEGGGLLPTDSANVTSTPESSPCSSPNRCALRFFLLPADSVVVVDRERRIALKAKHSRRRKKVIHFRLSYCRPLPPRSLSNFHGTRQIWRKRGGVEPTHVRIARDDLYRNCTRPTTAVRAVGFESHPRPVSLPCCGRRAKPTFRTAHWRTLVRILSENYSRPGPICVHKPRGSCLVL